MGKQSHQGSEVNNFEKQIKRNIYGKPQSILVTFPAGLGSAAQAEAQYILEHLWFENKFQSEIKLVKNALRIDQIHMFAVVELLMRSQCITDIRLIMNESKVPSVAAFEKKCHEIVWELYMASEISVKIKVDCGASPLLHEGAMKEILTNGLKQMVNVVKPGTEADDAATLYVDVYKYQMTMSISLAGTPLYKRGYRSVLSSSAPLREDIAACCIQKALQFAVKNNADYVNHSLLVPFSGTGTFLFEYLISHYQFAPALFGRAYAIQSMPLFRGDNFNYLIKKARENCTIENLKSENYFCVDNAESANEALLKNINNFETAVKEHGFSWSGGESDSWIHQEDFLTMDVAAKLNDLPGNILIAMNPPYGLRMGKSNDAVKLYTQIARQINALAVITKKRRTQLAGFILCPSEEAWSAFCKTLSGAAIDTYHLTQGGLDIRVAQFQFHLKGF